MSWSFFVFLLISTSALRCFPVPSSELGREICTTRMGSRNLNGSRKERNALPLAPDLARTLLPDSRWRPEYRSGRPRPRGAIYRQRQFSRASAFIMFKQSAESCRCVDKAAATTTRSRFVSGIPRGMFTHKRSTRSMSRMTARFCYSAVVSS